MPEATQPVRCIFWVKTGAFYGQEQHKSAKQNASIGQSPAQLVVSRVNHVFCAFVGVAKLELMRVQTGLNHFGLRNKLFVEALRASRKELFRIRDGRSSLVLRSA